MLMQITIKTYLFVFDVVIPFGSGCIGRWGTMVSHEDGVSNRRILTPHLSVVSDFKEIAGVAPDFILVKKILPKNDCANMARQSFDTKMRSSE
jgi:hypothetical protein